MTLPRRSALILLVYIAFIALGLPDGIFGVAWPSMRRDFEIPIDAMGLAMATGTIGYLLSSFFSGRLTVRLSIGGFLALSCGLAGLALVADCYVPAWSGIVFFAFFLGLGSGGIDAGLNTYVASNFKENQMHWMHACWGIGVTAGPLLMTASLQATADWRPAYLGVGGLQFVLAAVFLFSVSAWRRFDTPDPAGERKPTSYDTPITQTLGQGAAWLGIVLFYLYSGAEMALGFWAYSILVEARGVEPLLAGAFAGSYWAIFTVGRLLSGFLSRHIPARRLLPGAYSLALAGSLLLWLNLHPLVSLAGLVITGFALAPIFPSLVSSTQSRVGARHTGNTIGMQMSAASLGVASVPALMGILARHASLEAITLALLALFGLNLVVYLLATQWQEARSRP